MGTRSAWRRSSTRASWRCRGWAGSTERSQGRVFMTLLDNDDVNNFSSQVLWLCHWEQPGTVRAVRRPQEDVPSDRVHSAAGRHHLTWMRFWLNIMRCHSWLAITVSVIVSSKVYRMIDCPVCPCQQCGAFQDGARVGLLHRGGPSLHWCWDRWWCWCWDDCTWTAFNKSAILAQMQCVVSKRKANNLT